MIRRAPGTPPTATHGAPRRFDLYCLAVDHTLAAAAPTREGHTHHSTIILPEWLLRLNHVFFVTHANDFAPEHLSFLGQAYATERNADGAPTVLLKITRDADGHATLTLGDPDTTGPHIIALLDNCSSTAIVPYRDAYVMAELDTTSQPRLSTAAGDSTAAAHGTLTLVIYSPRGQQDPAPAATPKAPRGTPARTFSSRVHVAPPTRPPRAPRGTASAHTAATKPRSPKA